MVTKEMVTAESLCILCGERKGKAEHLVGPRCYKKFLAEKKSALRDFISSGSGREKGVGLSSWTGEEGKKILPSLQEELEVMRAKYSNLQKSVWEEGYKQTLNFFRETRAPRKEFLNTLKERRQHLWVERGGNQLYRELIILKARISGLEKILEKLKTQVSTPTSAQLEEMVGPLQIEARTD